MDHEHTLQKKSPGAPYTCSGCRQLGFGSSYHCQNSSCNYVLHEECAKPDPFGFHGLLENSYFEFHKKPAGDRERYCDACAKDISGFVYHCSTTGYDLHPCCLKLEKEISDESGTVTLKLSNEVHSKCVKCKQKSVVGKVKGWCYYDRNSCYHVSCFKDLILDNWRSGYFSQEERSIASSSSSTSNSRENQLALTSMEMNKKLKISSRGRTIRKYTMKIAVVVLKLIFSAIFGNPISAIAAVLEALASD